MRSTGSAKKANMKNNSNQKVNILGIYIDNLGIYEANHKIKDFVDKPADDHNNCYYVVKPYVEFITKAHKSPQIKAILNNADLVLPDGISLQWASSYIYGSPRKAAFKTVRSLLFWIHKSSWRTQVLKQNLGGPNQTVPLLKIAEENNWKVGILGGKQNELDTRKQNLAKIFPKLTNLYCWHGYFDSNDTQKMFNEMKSKKLDILFVAMGFPKQEEFIYTHRKSGLAKVLIGEGGTFDYDQLGGNAKRAPKNIQNMGLEWLWRVVLQPKRILRLFSIAKFIVLIKLFPPRN